LNPEDYTRTDLVTELGPFLACLGAFWVFALWGASLWLRGRYPKLRNAAAILGGVLVALGVWLVLQAIGQTLSLATSWPLPLLAVIGGVAAELLVRLYEFERSLVKLQRGRLLLTLRLLALAVLLLIFAQPVRSFIEKREISREVAILLDDSRSMHLSDQRLDSTEKLDRAALFGVDAAKNRPPFAAVASLAGEMLTAFEEEQSALANAPSVEAGFAARSETLPEWLTQQIERNTRLGELVDILQKSNLPGEAKNRVADFRKRSVDGLGRILPLLQTAFKDAKAEEFLKQLEVARQEIEPIPQSIASTQVASDKQYYDSLPGDARKEIDQAASADRIEIARRVLSTPLPGLVSESSETEQSLLQALGEKYNLRLYRFDREIEQVSLDENALPEELSPAEAPTRSFTDLAGALEHVLDNTSPESLAGVLLLSDGRHNAAALPEDALRRLAVQNSPLSAVPIGGRVGPVDISLLSLNAPESIYLDDHVVTVAEARIDGFLGETVTAELVTGDKVVDSQELKVTDANFRSELRFVHKPEARGIVDYQVRFAPDKRELFTDNNAWDFKVAVTDDRTNVLLVDQVPRWEYRYLRNLFYGRDKSVHLQYVLLEPDKIQRARLPDPVAASASRPFGDAEATRLPESAEEWQRFDVIILGDISPTALGFRDWEAIEENVTKRGALLVCVAGPRHMPHAQTSDVFQKLLPVTYTPSLAARTESPEAAFQIELTNAGRTHPVTSQSSSPALNAERWAKFPEMTWRFVGDSVKEGAEVLAYAHPRGQPTLASVLNPDGSPGSIEAALGQLANRQQNERDEAVVTTTRVGLGKVLLLHSDQSWRFRYGVGDTYHHRFWGQITRWGAGPNLRSGNDLVRLGSDRLSYTPSDSIEVTAKVLDETRRPLTGADVDVEIWKDGERLRRQRLSYRSDSSGIYETTLSGLAAEGAYELKLVGSAIDKAISSQPDGPTEVSTELLVVSSRNPVELAELTADRDFLGRATSSTSGHLAELPDLASLTTAFGAPKETLTERRNVTLWDKWPLLLSFVGLLTSEWILRRRSGLV